jgi:hypothetical protein
MLMESSASPCPCEERASTELTRYTIRFSTQEPVNLTTIQHLVDTAFPNARIDALEINRW